MLVEFCYFSWILRKGVIGAGCVAYIPANSRVFYGWMKPRRSKVKLSILKFQFSSSPFRKTVRGDFRSILGSFLANRSRADP